MFNVSIPRHHIPLSDWVFQHGPAENDPEFGADAWASAWSTSYLNDHVDAMEVDTESDKLGKGKEKTSNGFGGSEVDAVGTWVSAKDGQRIGGKTGRVTFTVVG